MLLGSVVFASALLRITLKAREAVQIVGWGALPIVLRALAGLAGIFDPRIAAFLKSAEVYRFPISVAWLRPLDVFEMAAALILGISLSRQPKGSIFKSILAVVLIAFAWCFTARGYFQPF